VSSGKTHTKITYATVFLTYVISIFIKLRQDFPWSPELLTTGVYLGMWLNPDLDIYRSLPHQRWRYVWVIWTPYQTIFDHRGNFFRRNFWTHCPGVGLAIRYWPILLLAFLTGQPAIIYGVIVIGLGILINDICHLMSDISQSYLGWPK
jgi:uncharacterized metal-binding protein